MSFATWALWVNAIFNLLFILPQWNTASLKSMPDCHEVLLWPQKPLGKIRMMTIDLQILVESDGMESVAIYQKSVLLLPTTFTLSFSKLV